MKKIFKNRTVHPGLAHAWGIPAERNNKNSIGFSRIWIIFRNVLTPILLCVLLGLSVIFIYTKLQKMSDTKMDTDFSRGVLAVNTNKSVYEKGEDVTIQMASLDSRGNTLCFSDLQLKISGPNFWNPDTILSTEKKAITENKSCGDNNVTNEPDYSAQFTPSKPGMYTLHLTNRDTGKSVVTSFEVASHTPVIEIERRSATRINPEKSDRYAMIIKVTANEDFQGTLMEYIPSNFKFAWQGPAQVENVDKRQKLQWDVALKKGETQEFAYDYTAPVVSPDFIRLGPAKVTATSGKALASEYRRDAPFGMSWQIASDAVTSPVGFWNLDEGNGTTTSDAINNLSGTLSGATTPSWQSENMCMSGKCLYFEGTTAYTTAGNQTTHQITSNLTLEAWVKLTTNDAIHTIIAKNGASGQYGYRLFTDANGKLNMEVSSNGTAVTSVVGNRTLSINTWYHLAGVYIPSTSLTVYVNALQDNQNTTSIPASINGGNTASLIFGAAGTGTTNLHKGFIDEVRVFNVARSIDEIRQTYTAGTAHQSAASGAAFAGGSNKSNDASLSQGLAGYWKTDESSGNASDASGNAIMMANTNSATFTTGKFGRAASLTRTSSQYFASATQTDTYTSQPDETSATDTFVYIDGAAADTPQGTEDILSIRSNTNYLTNTLLKFDLSTIPANAVITSATLSLWHYSTVDGNGTWAAYAVKSANSNWSEGSTWNYKIPSTTRWPGDSGNNGGTDAGCNVSDTDYNSTAMGSVNLTSGEAANTQYDISLSVSQMQTMLSANYGFIIKETTGSDAGHAHSSSSTTAGYRPKLVVNYSIPSNVEALDITGDLTVSAWIKPSSNTASTQYDIAGKWDGSNTSYLLAQYGSDLRMYIGSSSNYASTSSLNLATGSWYHVLATYQAATSTVKMVVNGTQQTLTVTGTIPSSIISNEGVFHIGADSSTTTSANFFNGLVDEVRVYNRTLTQSEINELYNWAPGPVLYYPFEDGSGTSAVDTSTNSQTGTLTSGPVWSQGKFGKGIKFTASADQSVIAADSTPLSLTSDLTVSGWINPASVTASTTFGIAGKWDAANKSYLLVQYGDEIRMYIGSADNYVTTSSTNLSTNTWYHVSAIYNAAAQTVTIYVNGVAQATSTTGTIPTSISDNASRFIVGYDNTAGTTFTRRITVNADDGWEENDTTWYSDYDDSGNGNGIVSCLGHYTFGVNDEDAALRFTNVTIAQGTRIASANITFTRVIDNTSGMTFKIVADEAADDAPAWSQASRPSSMNETEATAAWTTAWSTSGTEVTSDFASVIQEIIDRPGWTSGYDIRIAIKNNGTTGDNDGCFRDSLGDSNNSPLLTVVTGGVGGFNGTLDEIKVYNYTRTQKQIVEDMNGGHPIGGSPIASQVGYWNFDEGYLTTANNKGSGSSMNGTLSSSPLPSWDNAGKINKSLYFNGTSSYVTLSGDPAGADILSDLSLSAWIKLSDISSTHDIAAKMGASGSYAYRFFTDTSGYVNLSLTAGGTTLTTVTGTRALSTNKWYHVAATYTPSTSMKVYVDGVLDATNTTSIPASIYNTSANFEIGSENGGGTNRFKGMIDEVKLYSSALTTDQIKLDYNQGTTAVLGSLSIDSTNTASNSAQAAHCVPGDTTSCAAPVGEWKMEETSTPSLDTSGNGNSLTWNGNTTARIGKFGKAVYMDGSGDYLQVSDPGTNSVFDFGSGESITLSAWIKPTTFIDYGAIFSKYLESQDDNWSLQSWGDGAGNSQKIAFTFKTSQGGVCPSDYCTYLSTDQVLTAGVWTHLAVTYTYGTGASIRLYVNGSVIPGSWTAGTGSYAPIQGDGTIKIGWSGYGTEYFNGLIDDAKIYHYARTPAQIAWDYNRGAPIARYKFDECTGAVANNSAPAADGDAGYDGTITPNAGRTTGTCSSGTATEMWNGGTNGKFNGSLDFDGSGDYVSMGDVTLVDGATEMSVCSWIKYAPESVTADGGIVGEYSGTPPGWLMWVDDVGAVFSRTNTVSFSVSPSVGTDGRVEGQNDIVTSGTWSHYCGTFKGATFIKLYKNGVLNSQNVSGTIASTVDTTTEPLLVGKWGNGSYFDGQIDDVQIYNYALTGEQIKTIYNENSAVRWGPITGTP